MTKRLIAKQNGQNLFWESMFRKRLFTLDHQCQKILEYLLTDSSMLYKKLMELSYDVNWWNLISLIFDEYELSLLLVNLLTVSKSATRTRMNVINSTDQRNVNTYVLLSSHDQSLLRSICYTMQGWRNQGSRGEFGKIRSKACSMIRRTSITDCSSGF